MNSQADILKNKIEKNLFNKKDSKNLKKIGIFNWNKKKYTFLLVFFKHFLFIFIIIFSLINLFYIFLLLSFSFKKKIYFLYLIHFFF
jgi:hypothetical protein